MDILEKSDLIGTLLMDGVKAQLKQQWTWAAAGAVGLHQTLRHGGGIRTGLAGGLATVTILATINGVYNLSSNWSKVKEVLRGDML